MLYKERKCARRNSSEACVTRVQRAQGTMAAGEVQTLFSWRSVGHSDNQDRVCLLHRRVWGDQSDSVQCTPPGRPWESALGQTHRKQDKQGSCKSIPGVKSVLRQIRYGSVGNHVGQLHSSTAVSLKIWGISINKVFSRFHKTNFCKMILNLISGSKLCWGFIYMRTKQICFLNILFKTKI